MFWVVACVGVPDLSYRFPIVIVTFPIDMFRFLYPVISISFSRPPFPFPLPLPLKNAGAVTVRRFSRPLPTAFIPSSACMQKKKQNWWHQPHATLIETKKSINHKPNIKIKIWSYHWISDNKNFETRSHLTIFWKTFFIRIF
jgi:hypothetical protein